MDAPKIEPELDGVSADIADYTVGFTLVKTHRGVQDACPAGSGSLVSIGSIRGILTAAHVLTNLVDDDEVGLVRFPRFQSTASQRFIIDYNLAEPLIIGTKPYGLAGPDLGFLKLSPEDAGTLEARGNVFFNLLRRRETILSDNQPKQPHFHGISGVIAEWTTDLDSNEHKVRVKGFHALYGVGLVVRQHGASDFDLIDFEVTYGPGVVTPRSFEGLSGGALWRVNCSKLKDDQLEVKDKMIFGVAFHQSDISDQRRIITCHGPKSVYGRLIDAVYERWQID